MVKRSLLLGLLFSSPSLAAGTPAPFILSVPVTAAEPSKSDAEVQFVSNGYWMSDSQCIVIRSSGNADADKQACKTVKFRASSRPIKALAPVWIAEPVLGSFVAPTAKSPSPPVTVDDYPTASLDKGEQGTVVLRVVVESDGKLSNCSVASSSSYDRLDNAAKLKFCRKLKVKPATLDGAPIASVNFTTVAFYSGN